MAPVAGAGAGQARSLFFDSLMDGRGQRVWAIFRDFARSFVKNRKGNDLVPVWDTGFAGDNLAHCATVLVPKEQFLINKRRRNHSIK